jgi:hypothetical protein
VKPSGIRSVDTVAGHIVVVVGRRAMTGHRCALHPRIRETDVREAGMRRAPVFAIVICTLAVMTSAQTPATGMVTLFDGTHLNNFNMVGTANWKLADGVVEATSGSGFLVSKETYSDFEIRAEFWVDEAANSGVYIRCQNANQITDTTCYEANIFDKRPDQSGRTGAIVHVAKPLANIDAGGKWNTYEITAKGPQLTVRLNGTLTAQPRTRSSPVARSRCSTWRGR